MPNAWILFVKDYAKKNDISYGCAISEAKESYKTFKERNSGKKLEPLPPIFPNRTSKKVETPKPVVKVIEKAKPIKVMRKPKLIENPTISKAEKKAIINELTVNLNALKKQQRVMPSASRLDSIAEMEANILKYSKM